MTLRIQDPAPPFELPSTSGEALSLASLRGKRVILYFYPRDNTPGCTTESVDFRDRYEELQALGVEVLGVSKDSLASHDRFREKYELPFPLLTDADNAVAEAYGAFGLKMLYGKQVKGTIRSTFLIDAEGRIEAIWSPVRVKGHAEEVLQVVKGEAEAPKPKAKAAAKKAAPKAEGKEGAKPASSAAKAAKGEKGQGRSLSSTQSAKGTARTTRGAARGR